MRYEIISRGSPTNHEMYWPFKPLISLISTRFFHFFPCQSRVFLQVHFQNKPSWTLAHQRIMKMILTTDFSQDFYSVCVNPCNLWSIFRTKAGLRTPLEEDGGSDPLGPLLIEYLQMLNIPPGSDSVAFGDFEHKRICSRHPFRRENMLPASIA